MNNSSTMKSELAFTKASIFVSGHDKPTDFNEILHLKRVKGMELVTGLNSIVAP